MYYHVSGFEFFINLRNHVDSGKFKYNHPDEPSTLGKPTDVSAIEDWFNNNETSFYMNLKDRQPRLLSELLAFVVDVKHWDDIPRNWLGCVYEKAVPGSKAINKRMTRPEELEENRVRSVRHISRWRIRHAKVREIQGRNI